MRSSRPFLRLALLSGCLGPLLFVGVVAGLTFAQYDFMRSLGWDPLRAPTFDWPSGLALGPYGPLMALTFLLGGGLLVIFALGLREALRVSRSARLGTTLLALAGIALAGLSFTTDPTIRSTPATWHGEIHDLSFVLLGMTLLPALFFLSLAFRRDPRWQPLWGYTLGTVLLAIPTFILKGAAFYLFLLAVLAWSEMIAAHFKKLNFLSG